MATYVNIIDGMNICKDADLMSWVEPFILSEGIANKGSGKFAVTQAGTPGMKVAVAVGTCFVKRDAYVEDNNTMKYWMVTHTASSEVNIDSNASGLTRIDAICVKIDTAATPDDEASNVATLVAVKGTPGAGNPAIPDNHLLLSYVTVADGATQILTASVTDARVYVGIVDEDTMTSDSAVMIPTQQSVKAYTSNLSVGDYNLLINGNFNICQRSPITPSIAITDVTNIYLLDRWKDYVNKNTGTLPTLTRTRETLTAGDIPNAYYYSRLTTNGAGTSLGTSSQGYYMQPIENGTRLFCGLNKTVTLSFYARSSISNKKIGATIFQMYGTGGSPTSPETLTGETWTLTSNWTKYTHTFTTNTLVGKTFGTADDDQLQVTLYTMWGSSIASVIGTTGAETYVGSGTIDIAQVQLVEGSTALPFRAQNPVNELSKCFRYCYGIRTLGTNSVIGIGTAYASTAAEVIVEFPTVMRALPTITATAGDWQLNAIADAAVDLTSISLVDARRDRKRVIVECGVASGLTVYRQYQLWGDGTANRIMYFDAEL